MELTIYTNRKFTRHDLSAYGQPNPDADAFLIASLADANDNGATTEGVEIDGEKLTEITGIGQDEVTLELAHYIASKGEGCEVLDADCCLAFIEILDLEDNPPPSLPGYTPKLDEDGESVDWTWGEWLAKPTIGATFREGGTFIGAGTFANVSTRLTATEHLSCVVAGLTLLHPSQLPAETE